MQVIVYRNDETPNKGETFIDLRDAMDRIKSRAASEEKTVRDYTILPVSEHEEV